MKTARVRELLDIVDATIPEESFIEFRFASDGAACQIRDRDFFRLFASKQVTRRLTFNGVAFYEYYSVADLMFHCCRDEKEREVETITLPAIEGGGS